MPSIEIDCTELSDKELNSLSQFLGDLPAIENVGVSISGIVDDLYDEDDKPISLRASAEPFYLTVHFLMKHWGAIVGAGTGASEVARVCYWVAQRFSEWNKARDAMYDFKPIYDADSKVLSIIKVKKSIQSHS